jgi:hypothetical protein
MISNIFRVKKPPKIAFYQPYREERLLKETVSSREGR